MKLTAWQDHLSLTSLITNAVVLFIEMSSCERLERLKLIFV